MLSTNFGIEQKPGVIWITGYSGAGKTTVARKVEALLRNDGVRTIFLDGDDLRSIFHGRWGYDRSDRVELAHVYFRLCSHLAAEGATVIIAAVAMYDEVGNWVRTNIPNAMQVYLDVPEEERRRRDARTKQVYGKISDLGAMYDIPSDPDLKIANHSGETPESVAARIVSTYTQGKFRHDAGRGRTEHWAKFYGTGKVATDPSPFAKDVAAQIDGLANLLEIGCGNGRDSAHFASLGHRVTAIDASPEAIELCQAHHQNSGICFLAGTLPDVEPEIAERMTVVYTRFVLHAMPENEERATLASAAACLRTGGRLFVECRSINDPMAGVGEVISKTERIHGHYRRFIILDDLVARVEEAGFRILSVIESAGLAIFGTEDPVVIRLVAERR